MLTVESNICMYIDSKLEIDLLLCKVIDRQQHVLAVPLAKFKEALGKRAGSWETRRASVSSHRLEPFFPFRKSSTLERCEKALL